jgi:hypothetical protein
VDRVRIWRRRGEHRRDEGAGEVGAQARHTFASFYDPFGNRLQMCSPAPPTRAPSDR